MDDEAKIAHYGETVRKELVGTYYGRQTIPVFLERTVRHAAQHLRQPYAFLDLMNMAPEDPLTAEDFAALPLPQNIWRFIFLT